MSDLVLRSSRLEVAVARPGERYRGTRFDWTSQVYSVVLDGRHEFLTSEKAPPASPENQGWGLAAEFGITRAWGYAAAFPHGQYPKIGVGALRRDSALRPYQFWHPYPLDPARFTVVAASDRVTMEAQSDLPRSRAWGLVRTWTAQENILRVDTTLTNRGRCPLVLEEYHHNFLSFQGADAVGWTLEASGWAGLGGVDKLVDPDQVWTWDSALHWTKAAVGDVFFADPRIPAPTSWTLRDASRRFAVTERLEGPARRFHLWGTHRVASPELFFEILLSPGESKTWSRTWAFEDRPR